LISLELTGKGIFEEGIIFSEEWVWRDWSS